jgi:glyoxylase-like metal-dependent hydrolase (beta-lactamase superfamily II)
MSLNIESQTLGPFETNTFLVTDDVTKHCVVVDAPPGAAEALLPLIRERGLVCEVLLLTHGHWDHIADARAFADAGVPICAHPADADCYAHPERYMPFYRAALPWLTETDFQAVKIEYWVNGGDTVTFLGREFEVRHVPGHCPGNVLFYCASEKLAFPGDAIFAGSVGRSDLPGGSWVVLLKSIREQIYTLPEDVVLLPGHGEETTVAQEIQTNPYARPVGGDK